MTQPNGDGGARSEEEGGPTGPIIRDKRKVDPHTGAVRDAKAAEQAGEQTDAEVKDALDDGAVGESEGDTQDSGDWVADDAADMTGAVLEETLHTEASGSEEPLTSDAQAAAERLEDLRRLQAEFVNYRRRVDRDRARDRDVAVGGALEAMLPVLDDIHSAREHGDLTEGPFASITEKLESVLTKLGAELFGAVGEVFDPTEHEALMHLPDAEVPEGASETTIVQVIQPGFRVGERLVRPARVAVADPQ
ncbi:MAG: nucleotide exchange factor GrpE [Ornithinimicrobium sp.]